MGRGDKKTKRGKITIGSFGNSRKKRSGVKAYIKTTPVATEADATSKEPPKKRAPKKKAAK